MTKYSPSFANTSGSRMCRRDLCDLRTGRSVAGPNSEVRPVTDDHHAIGGQIYFGHDELSTAYGVGNCGKSAGQLSGHVHGR